MRDCYYVFIPGGARKSSSIQLARDDEHFCCLLPSHFYTTVVPEKKNGKNPNANLAILFGASARYQIRCSLWFFAWKKGRRQQQDDK